MSQTERAERFVTRASHGIKIDLSHAKGPNLLKAKDKEPHSSKPSHSKELTQLHLVRAIAKDTGLSQAQVEIAVVSFLEEIGRAARESGEVRLAGFGSFSISQKPRGKVSVRVNQPGRKPDLKPKHEFAD